MQTSPHAKPRPGDAAMVVSLLWLYIGCRASVRVLGAVQAVLPR
jgi:hypothetical protein